MNIYIYMNTSYNKKPDKHNRILSVGYTISEKGDRGHDGISVYMYTYIYIFFFSIIIGKSCAPYLQSNL